MLIPAKFKVDIFSEIDRLCNFGYKLFIVDKTIGELNNIVDKQKGKEKAAAKLALLLIKNKKVDIIETKEGKVDDIILGLNGYTVATQDKELKRRLKKKNVETITLRQKRYLVLT